MLLLLAAVAAPVTTVEALVYKDLPDTFASFGTWAVKSIGRGSPKPKPASNANSFTPEPPFISAPTNLAVTATSITGISLGWNAPAGAVHHYEVERSESVSEPFVLLANAAGTTFTDNTVTNLHTYLYRVRAIETTAGCALVPSTPSNMVMGTTALFEFTQAQNQPVRAQHFHDLRNVVNAVRAAANLPAAIWTRSNLTNLEIKALDVQELRNQLTDALNVLNITVGGFDDPVLSTGANGTRIRAIHLEQLQTNLPAAVARVLVDRHPSQTGRY